ncbi:hypothetical protein [Nocardia farcinica]|uniref:hypothetical protein n=1 Tax=Nocardia farcinica TaxID=37329 RepID=UPI001893E44E|nr:hypothetical protein [Nocardia farcinica]MBF6140179.1 hypothetical protein [Nocardia farcinica]MBF6255548.1 hypothetical protein [Nocardia farcinica]MBF6387429.1 hypothetical protein [Nocardia farcinica]MBF6537968.1 hypothetical protein [Nocardia farcinica]
MTALFVLDVPENKPVAEVAGRDPAVSVDRVGPYFKISAPGPIRVDRRATGCRHAVWYSSVAGLIDSRIVQWDKDALEVRQR